MFTRPTSEPALEWEWVEGQLREAEMYWVVPAGGAHPHPRPVWGVWDDDALHLSVGSPVLKRLLDAEPAITVHLESGLDVVVLEGTSAGPTTEDRYVTAYDAKYDWRYDLDQYGPLTTVAPTTVLAWRAVGVAGRDGFEAVGRWSFPA